MGASLGQSADDSPRAVTRWRMLLVGFGAATWVVLATQAAQAQTFSQLDCASMVTLPLNLASAENSFQKQVNDESRLNNRLKCKFKLLGNKNLRTLAIRETKFDLAPPGDVLSITDAVYGSRTFTGTAIDPYTFIGSQQGFAQNPATLEFITDTEFASKEFEFDNIYAFCNSAGTLSSTPLENNTVAIGVLLGQYDTNYIHVNSSHPESLIHVTMWNGSLALISTCMRCAGSAQPRQFG